jgi:6-phosphogluconate dehydrogenase
VELAIVGLGRMGGNMARRLHQAGHRVVAYNRSFEKTQEIMGEGLEGGREPADVVGMLRQSPRIVWLMVPAGDATEETMNEFAALLEPGDTIVDGGNSNFKDSKRRHEAMQAKGINFIDAGISGGIWGLVNGYGTMVGGDPEAVTALEPIFKSLAPPDGGYVYCGPAGAGHYTKMVHNGIEYGLMQAYAEGFAVMEKSEFALDLHEIAGIWRYGSVVRSWLLELLVNAFEVEGSDLEKIRGYVEDSGEGRWTIAEAIAEDVPVPVITAALFARFASREDESFAAKVNAALRNQFGGHAVKAAE